MRLQGSVGIITGASRGIGAVLAEALAERGVHLALAARSKDDLEATAARVGARGVRVAAIPTDVTSTGELEELVQRTTDELGPIDLLVNNAGIEQLAHFATIDPTTIEQTLRTNLVAAELLTRFALPQMIERRHGHIVNISSLSGRAGYPYSAVYSSSKWGLLGFSASLREELKPYGIGVSAICPSHVASVGVFADRHPDSKAPFLTRPVTPEKVAAATIAAIERNRAEVIVAHGLGKLTGVFHAISPDLVGWVARKGGVYDFLRKDASKHSPPP